MYSMVVPHVQNVLFVRGKFANFDKPYNVNILYIEFEKKLSAINQTALVHVVQDVLST